MVAGDIVLGEEDPKLHVKTRSCLHPPYNTLLSVLLKPTDFHGFTKTPSQVQNIKLADVGSLEWLN